MLYKLCNLCDNKIEEEAYRRATPENLFVLQDKHRYQRCFSYLALFSNYRLIITITNLIIFAIKLMIAAIKTSN